jgi:mRNA interferase MazF
MAAGVRRLRWAVVIADLEPVAGHEQGGTRRVLVVSNEPFHRSGRVSVCPITTAWTTPRYPNEVAIPRGQAGQAADAVILCHQVRTISLARVRTEEVLPGSGIRYVTDPAIRSAVRDALGRHFGLDMPPSRDGASVPD